MGVLTKHNENICGVVEGDFPFVSSSEHVIRESATAACLGSLLPLCSHLPIEVMPRLRDN